MSGMGCLLDRMSWSNKHVYRSRVVGDWVTDVPGWMFRIIHHHGVAVLFG